MQLFTTVGIVLAWALIGVAIASPLIIYVVYKYMYYQGLLSDDLTPPHLRRNRFIVSKEEKPKSEYGPYVIYSITADEQRNVTVEKHRWN